MRQNNPTVIERLRGAKVEKIVSEKALQRRENEEKERKEREKNSKVRRLMDEIKRLEED